MVSKGEDLGIFKIPNRPIWGRKKIQLRWDMKSLFPKIAKIWMNLKAVTLLQRKDYNYELERCLELLANVKVDAKSPLVLCMEDLRHCVTRELEFELKCNLMRPEEDIKETEKSLMKLINWLRKFNPDYPDYVSTKSMFEPSCCMEEEKENLGSEIPETGQPIEESDDEVEILEVIMASTKPYAKTFVPRANPRSAAGHLVVFDPATVERDFAEEKDEVPGMEFEMD